MPNWWAWWSNFTILDTDDQIRLLKRKLIVAASIDENAGRRGNWPG